MITGNGPGRFVGRCTSRSCSASGPYATPATGGTAVTLRVVTSERFVSAATGNAKVVTPVAMRATIAHIAAKIVPLRLVAVLGARCSSM